MHDKEKYVPCVTRMHVFKLRVELSTYICVTIYVLLDNYLGLSENIRIHHNHLGSSFTQWER